MRRTSLTATFGAVLFTLACGGGGGNNPAAPNNPNSAGTMSASIDGSSWTALGVTTGRSTGVLILAGTDVQRTMTVSFFPTATGTQQIALGIVTIGGSSWQANASGVGSGSVTLTTLTATRAVGTFTFTGVGSQGASPASRQVTNGRFDVRY